MRTRLLVAFVGLAIVPLLIVGAVISRQSFFAQRQQAIDLQAEAALRAATEVVGFISGLEQQLRVTAQVHHLTNLDAEARYSVLFRLSSYGDDFEELAMLNARGQEQERVSRVEAVTSLELVDRSGEDEFPVPVGTGDTYYSPVRFDAVTGEPFMTIAVPVVDARSGRVDGVLVADIRLKEIWDLVALIRVGESGSAYIVDDQGRVLAHRDPSVVLRGTQYVVPESDGIHLGITGATVVVAAADVHLGVQTLTVVTERPLSEALALTIRTVIITAVLIVAALVCAGLLGFYAARRIVRPIRALATTAQAISAGELWRQAETSGHDELGLLGSTFNRMTAQLRDMIESLEERVEERTKELSETNTALETEIAERKHVEQALRESEEQSRELYEGAPLAYFSVSLDGHIRMVNCSAEELLGYPRDALIGRSVIDLHADTPMGKEAARGMDERLRAGVEARGQELQMATAERGPIWVSLTVRLVRDRQGQIVERRRIVTEITERKRAEETGRELAVVEERNRLAREIHDTLAQSLIAIMIQLETAGKLLVCEPEAATVEIQSARDLARRSLEEARRSVWDLHSARRDSIDLTGVIRQEATSTAEDAVQLSMEVEGTEPESIDPRNELTVLRITQEALSNVRQHSKASRATVRLSYDVSEVRVLVSDDGCGFEPSQTKGVLSAAGGFGLTSMQERARLAGGNLEIRSASGRGTQINATIPYQVGTERPPVTQHTANAVLSKEGLSEDIRVLVADDQDVVRRGIRSMLTRSDGLVVVGEAGDGEAAIEQIRALAPDVVLLDIQLPRLDGVETTKRLRELGLKTKVILLSVYAKDEYIFDGLRADARGYLMKDVGEDDLVRAIRTVQRGGSLLEPVIAKRLIEQLEDGPGPQLTQREMEVLRALTSGARDKEIAGALSLSVRTVRFHVENIYQKLSVQTRTQAVRVASERGILNS